MLVLVRSLSYTPDASFSEEEFLLHSSVGFTEEYIASFSEEFLLHSWGLALVRSFYTEEFLLHC